MSKLSGAPDSFGLHARQQTPDEVLKVIGETEVQFDGQPVSHTLLYTDALYFNSDQKAADVARKISDQLAAHIEGMKKRIGPNAENIEFLSWNQAIADGGSKGFESNLNKLRELYKKDTEFASLMRSDTRAAHLGKAPTDADVQFILNELVIFEQIRRGIVQTPLAQGKSEMIAICYPGKQLASDQYLQEHKYKPSNAVWVNDSSSHNALVETPKHTFNLWQAWTQLVSPKARKIVYGAVGLAGLACIIPAYHQTQNYFEDNALEAKIKANTAPWTVNIQRDALNHPAALTLCRGETKAYFYNPDNLFQVTVLKGNQIDPLTNVVSAVMAMQYQEIAERALGTYRGGYPQYSRGQTFHKGVCTP